MKNIIRFSILILFSVSPYAYSQNDSLAVISAPWQTQKIAKGIILKQHQFKGALFNSNQTISILEIKKQRKDMLDLGYEEKELKLTSEFGREAGAIAALNGSFFDVKIGGSVDYLRSDGRVISTNQLKENERDFHQKAAVAIQKGILSIEKWNGKDDWETGIKAEDILLSGPLLIFDENMESIDSSSFNVTRHPRTAVSITGKGRILLITVDGRDENAAGMSLFELRNFLRWLDVDDAINFDGGGSTTLWISNQPENGIVNYPCDDRKWNHAGERKVANVLLVQKTK